jgi:TrmH family RNA methyltransferase
VEPLGPKNSRIQQLRRLLGRRSSRREAELFVVEGSVLLFEALRSGLTPVAVYSEEDFFDEVRAAVDPGVPVWAVRSGVLSDLAGALRTTLAVFATDLDVDPGTLFRSAAGQNRPVLVGVGLADPGNVGTLIRAAEASGAAGVALAGDAVDVYNPKVVRSSAGSIFRLPICVELSVGELLDHCRALQLPLYAATAEAGRSHWEINMAERCAIAVGNEAHGLEVAILESANELVSIEHDGEAESLNVAMAATVLLFEAMRQRKAK